MQVPQRERRPADPAAVQPGRVRRGDDDVALVVAQGRLEEGVAAAVVVVVVRRVSSVTSAVGA